MILFHSFILVVVGLAFEARIAGSCKGATICCRRGGEAGMAMVRALDDPNCHGVISFGIAGGLDRKLPTGSHLVASHVVTPKGTLPTDPPWSQQLLRSSPRALHAPILGMDHVVVDPEEKRELFASTGAAAVDTESHITAMMANERGLPFTCLRIIADPAHRKVPKAAMSGLREDGRAYPAGVIRALLRRPHETPALLAIARDTWRARRVLAAAIDLAGDHVGLPPPPKTGRARAFRQSAAARGRLDTPAS
jgi:hopanoid-associated phosphorylase